RGGAMGNGAAGRNHHGFVDGAVLRGNDLLLIAGAANRLRRVAVVAAGGSSGRDRGENRSGEKCGENAGHGVTCWLEMTSKAAPQPPLRQGLVARARASNGVARLP